MIYPESCTTTHRIITQTGEPLNAFDVQKKLLRAHLAYHIHVALENAQDGYVQRDFLIDAHDGSVLQNWNSLMASGPSGTGHSQYSGTVLLEVNNIPGAYELRDKSRGKRPHPFTGEVGNLVYAGNKSAGLAGAWGVSIYQDPDNNWGDGTNYIWTNSQQTTNGQTAAVDAAYGIQVAWDMYRNVLGRDGIDDKGTSTYSVVHHNNTRSYLPNPQMDNAYWESDCFCICFMDGYLDNQSSFSTSVTSPDIVGHEMSHGVCAHTAGLIYYGESGGLNESNSDIFGTMAEYYSKGGAYDIQASTIPDTGGNWTIGEQHNTQGIPYRWMYRPSRDRYSPDAWSSDLKDMEVHNSSGPMNRAFALLSQGSGDGDWASTPAVKGLGNTKASQLWYHALASYLYPSSDYANARRSTLRAALDLYPSEPSTIQAVRDAFAAINVGDSAGTGDDVIGPTVALSGGGNSGRINFTATALDENGISGVTFLIDGLRFDHLQSPPYTAILDSTQFSNGPHSVVAKAYDTNGNQTISNSINFTLDNPSQQLLLDPGLERGNTIWFENGTHILPGGDELPTPHGGKGLARFIAGRCFDRHRAARIRREVEGDPSSRSACGPHEVEHQMGVRGLDGVLEELIGSRGRWCVYDL